MDTTTPEKVKLRYTFVYEFEDYPYVYQDPTTGQPLETAEQMLAIDQKSLDERSLTPFDFGIDDLVSAKVEVA